MSLLNQFADFLKGSVGNNLENRPDDIKSTKRRLKQVGFYDDDTENEFITQELDHGIRKYQRDKGLKEDGRLFPAGETERSLYETITGRISDTLFGNQENDDQNAIGFGGNVSGTFKKPSFQTPSFNPLNTEIGLDLLGSKKAKPLNMLRDFEADVFNTKDNKIADKDLTAVRVASVETKNDADRHADAPTPKQKAEDKVVVPRILKDYDDEVVKSEIRKHENTFPYMYKDTAKGGGKVTTGTGILIDSVDKAVALPFKIRDKNGHVRDATPKEIKTAYEKVNNVKQPEDNTQAFGAWAFEPKKGKLAKDRDLDDVFLTDDDEKKIFDQAVREHVGLLHEKFEGFDSFPPPAQRVLLDLQFNTGLNLETSWDELQKAITIGDWQKASKEVNRLKVSNERNQWAREEMLKAAH